MKSKIFSFEYIKSTSKGQLWIPAFLFLGFFMAFPAALLLKLGGWKELQYSHAQIRMLYENLWQDGFMITGFFVAAAAAMMNGISSFWYLYSARKVDFYHSLPAKRSGMFWQRVCTGLLYYLAPYILMIFLTLCFGAARGFMSLKLVGMALRLTGLHLLLYFLIYFSTVLVIFLTGNIFMGVLVLGGLLLYGPVLGMVLDAYREFFYRTTYVGYPYGIRKILAYASPLNLGYYFVSLGSKDGEGGRILIIIAAAAAVFGVLAYLAYQKRPSERTNSPVIYGWTGTVLKFMVTVPFGLGIGIIFYTLPMDDSKELWWVFGMALGVILCHGVLEVLYHLDVRSFFARKGHLVLAAALTVFVAFWYRQDLGGYDSYIPPQDEIADIHLELYAPYALENNFIKQTGEETYQVFCSWDDPEFGLCKDAASAAKLRPVLEDIIDCQEKFEDEDNLVSYAARNVGVKYTLKSGREVYRRYIAKREQLYDLLYYGYAETPLKEYEYSRVLELKSKYLKSMEIIMASGMNYTLFENQEQELEEFWEALRDDMESADAEILMGQPVAQMYLDFRVPVEENVDKMVPDGIRKKDDQYNWNPFSAVIYIYPSFEKTLAILEKSGYAVYMEDADVEEVEIDYDGGSDQLEPVRYTEKKELDILKKSLIASGLDVVWLEKDETLPYAAVKIKGSSGWFSASFKDNQVPDFVREVMEKNPRIESDTEEAYAAEDMIIDGEATALDR